MGVQHYKYRFCFKILFNPIAVAEGGGGTTKFSHRKFANFFYTYMSAI